MTATTGSGPDYYDTIIKDLFQMMLTMNTITNGETNRLINIKQMYPPRDFANDPVTTSGQKTMATATTIQNEQHNQKKTQPQKTAAAAAVVQRNHWDRTENEKASQAEALLLLLLLLCYCNEQAEETEVFLY